MSFHVMAPLNGQTVHLSLRAPQKLSLCSPGVRQYQPFRLHRPRAAARTVVLSKLAQPASAQATAPAESSASENCSSWLGPALLAAGAPLTLAAQALAEPINGSVGAKQADAIAQTAKDTVQDAVQSGPPAPSPIEILLVLSPILLYGVFSLYRSKVNPRAKLSDFSFIVVGLVIVANLVSIIVFKVRFF